jgi:hypothetical protein
MAILICLLVCVFTSTAITIARVLPGPHNPLDYLVVGAISVLVSMSVLFAAVLRSNRSNERQHVSTIASSDRDLRR